jgi:hypothetical protein
MANDPKWTKSCWFFDDYASFDQLRKMQMSSGPEMVHRYADLFIGDLRQKLLSSISLMCLVCGAGKTLQMVATMLAINAEVNARVKDAPRCKKALWFVMERLLARQLEGELKTEIIRFNLHHTPPEIQICDETGDLARGPGQHHITISCPHALWKKNGGLNPGLTEEQVKLILSQYDVIIWDECDFARWQMDHLAKCAPHALKFGLTAAAIDAKGKDLSKHFVLAGVASYKNVSDFDHCLKRIIPWSDATGGGFIKGISHDGFEQINKGEDEIYDAKHKEHHSLPGAMATIRTAINDCNNLEARMKKGWPADWYSPHILVACNSVLEADHFCHYTDLYLRHLNEQGSLVGDGWRATIMHEKIKPNEKAEKHLVHKDGNIHPFMRAKYRDGRCERGSSRILFVVDMAIRGMNNWPLLFIVDLKRSDSVNTQVQLLGRILRLPPRLSSRFRDNHFNDCCTGRYYYPDSGSKNIGAMPTSYEFMLNMDERLQAANFIQWSHLLQGVTPEELPPAEGIEKPFTREDRLQIDAELGDLIDVGKEVTEEQIDYIIGGLPGMPEPNPETGSRGERGESARQHIQSALTDRDYRARMVKITVEDDKILKPIKHEEPKKMEDYTNQELREFIKSVPEFESMLEQMSELLTNAAFRLSIAKQRREHDVRLYRPVPKILQLQDADGKPGLVTDIARALASSLVSRGLIDKKDVGRVFPNIYIATGIVTGMSGDGITKNDSKLDQPAYHHILSLPHSQKMIKDIAVAFMVRKGLIKNISLLYSDVIND